MSNMHSLGTILNGLVAGILKRVDHCGIAVGDVKVRAGDASERANDALGVAHRVAKGMETGGVLKQTQSEWGRQLRSRIRDCRDKIWNPGVSLVRKDLAEMDLVARSSTSRLREIENLAERTNGRTASLLNSQALAREQRGAALDLRLKQLLADANTIKGYGVVRPDDEP